MTDAVVISSLVVGAATTPIAVGLAVVAALLFGLAAVRQHSVVQTTAGTAVGGRSAGLWTLVRQPAWLLGGLQAGLAGGLHGLALALAPITVVQPVGVLAVPVTVIATAIRRGVPPGRGQVVGSVLGVAGLAGLTLLLLRPVAEAAVVWPAPAAVALVSAGLVVVTLLLANITRRAASALRCALLAVSAAVLFGFTSVLVRTVGHLVTTGGLAGDRPLLVTAVLGVAVCAPVGMWAVQTAYRVGSPPVVICCLTLVDPITAVLGGRLLLHESVGLSAPSLAAAVGCALVAAAGVAVLSKAYPSTSPSVLAPARTSSTSSRSITNVTRKVQP